MLVCDALALLSFSDDWQLDGESLLNLVKFGTAVFCVTLVLQVQIKVVQAFNAKDKRALINVKLRALHVLTELGVDSHGEGLREVLLAIIEL